MDRNRARDGKTARRPATRVDNHVIFPGGRVRKLTLCERLLLRFNRLRSLS